MQLLNPHIEDYASNHSSEESETVKKILKISKKNLDHTDMISGRAVGRLLALLIKISRAKTVLEIGTFTGYSALCMAESLPDEGSLITCELNEHYEELARSAFNSSTHGHKITLIMGPALKTIEKQNQLFDFVFLDADKVNYPNYYKVVLPKLKSGGLFVIDNVLWEGTVLNPNDEKAQAIDNLNKTIVADNRVEQVMLTVRDGITIARKL